MKNKVSSKKLKEFGIFIGLSFPIFFGIIIPFITKHTFPKWFLFAGIPFFLIGIFRPKNLFWPYKIWMKISEILGWFNSKIILSIVYIIMVIPIGFLIKIFNYDPLQIKKRNLNSYKEYLKKDNIDLKRIF